MKAPKAQRRYIKNYTEEAWDALTPPYPPSKRTAVYRCRVEHNRRARFHVFDSGVIMLEMYRLTHVGIVKTIVGLDEPMIAALASVLQQEADK